MKHELAYNKKLDPQPIISVTNLLFQQNKS